MRTSNPILKLFGRSPFRPMQEHMKLVAEAAEQVVPLFEALQAGRESEIAAIKDRIFALEDQADDLKNNLRSHLPKSLFMPVDRRDLLDLLHAQDSIADTAQDIAGLLVMRKMPVPEFMRDLLLPYVRRCVEAVHKCKDVIDELDELLEMGFRGREAEHVERMVDELGDVETDSDRLGMDLTKLLFEREDDMKPLVVVFWHQLIELIGDIADYSEDVGDRLRLLIAR